VGVVNPILRETINAVRAHGFDLFIFPCRSPWGFSGQAFTSAFTRHINVFKGADEIETAFVIWHEVGHLIGHLGYNSTPHWQDEWRCERFALRMLHGTVSTKEYERLEELARAHIRPLLQGMIDDEIWNHVNLEAADWARCKIPLKSRCHLLEMEDEYGQHRMKEITQL